MPNAAQYFPTLHNQKLSKRNIPNQLYESIPYSWTADNPDPLICYFSPTENREAALYTNCYLFSFSLGVLSSLSRWNPVFVCALKNKLSQKERLNIWLVIIILYFRN